MKYMKLGILHQKIKKRNNVLSEAKEMIDRIECEQNYTDFGIIQNADYNPYLDL